MDRCLDENELQAFFRGRLVSAQNDAVQAHLDRCSTCRHLVAELARGTEPDERIVLRDGRLSRRRTQAASPAPPGPGTVLADRWRLVRVLGRGGTGVVWEATHAIMHRRVAIKLLASTEDAAMRRFFREARVTSALRHPHIVEVHDVFAVPETGGAAMVMEYLEGDTLVSALRRRPDLAFTARVLLQIVSALATAHAAGVVHRDLKPGNVFLVDAPTPPVVKVLDFGLAKLTASEGAVAATANLTRKGAVVGTPHYMAPEQIAADPAIDARTDVWALGVMLYECLAGARPIDGANVAKIFHAIAAANVVPLAMRAPHVPPPLAALTMRMLSAAKDARPSLREIHDALVIYA